MRMVRVRNYYESSLHASLWWYRASRVLASNVQRMWRGFKARSQFRHAYEIRMLPDPLDMRNFDFWKKCQYEAGKAKRELGIYAEYTLSGTPRTWTERSVKRRDMFYRDCSFYANTITKRATWTKVGFDFSFATGQIFVD